MSKIQWTEETWNPIVGCTKVSQGCKHCYAEVMAKRIKAMGHVAHYQDVVDERGWTGQMRLAPRHILEMPLRRRKPTTYFVNSMSDLFHEGVEYTDLTHIFEVMNSASRHTFIILTKRADRMREFIPDWFRVGQPRIWCGVSVEDQATADERLHHLVRTPAAIRLVSYEPALGPVDFSPWMDSIDWIIVGGESGPKAREFEVNWARDVKAVCEEHSTAFFMKQMGRRPYIAIPGKAVWLELKDSKGGDISEWPEDLRVREIPERVTA